jgi:hypothetical protein
VYYVGQRPAQLEHRLGVNCIRLWLQQRLKSWETLEIWQYEVNYGQLRPDALAAIKNSVTGKLRLMFIEYDRAYNKFDKVAKYERFYNGELYKNFLPVMPTVFVVGNNVKLPTDSKIKYVVIKIDFSDMKGVL